ncbi:TrmH family RNA methyltransferase [Pseudobdellovibrio exovorus]|uniref:Putative tRNA/rRNA methyltransferase n=1 Tax=Pseudobdellovibrio exovorus JSS TaxID=1184267 RepID=M4VCA4_9BACT|nr:TrmH family RNA methyltransferase [Pseudobdellovibrio exovorus]AGH95666.1 putative tRNA/rRNA methyltransferase [Pseudobdellovibrio exovorus JSS]
MSTKAKLEEIYNLFQGLEMDSRDGQFDEPLLEHLISCITELEKSEDPILQKLSKYKTHLNPQMTLRHFSTIAVPFERYLKKTVQDDDFLVSSTDRDHLVTERVPLHFVVDNMRSAFNVGSIFRTADTLGAKKIWLTGYTPTPHQPQVEKSALGAAFIMDWQTTSFTQAIEELKAAGTYIIALETSAKALDIGYPYQENKPMAFVIGNERFGLDADQLALCDEIRRIPTFGIKNSLNAATAAAIAGYEWRKQWNESKIKV